MARLAWVDIMKGIGILSVVAGHVYSGDISRTIYIFHMPLFFFISGYLYKPTPDLKKHFINKVIHLLIPYIMFLIPIYLFFNRLLLTSSPPKDVLFFFLNPILGGKALTGATGVFWFVTCLFLVQQIMNFLIVKFKIKTILIILIFLLILSYINSLLLPTIWLPWGANVICAAAPIYYIGYLFKRQQFKVHDILLLGIGVIIFGVSFYFPENTYDMKEGDYGIPLITLFSSIVFILNIKYLSQKLTSINFLAKPLTEIGKASMVIMFMHQPLQILLEINGLHNQTLRFLVATILSFLLFLLFSKFGLTRALFLGSRIDLQSILKRK